MIAKFPDSKKNRLTYVGNMSDLLQIVRDTKQDLIAQHGVEEGTERFGKLRAKDVLDRYSITAGAEIH